MRAGIVVVTGSLATLCVAGSPAAADRCSSEAVAALKVPHLSVTSAAHVAPEGPLPEHCNVKGTVATDGEGAGPNAARIKINLPDVRGADSLGP
ncbi:MAG TPA: hypothetical protein VEH77_06060 [Roseiarcus sp.]|nr:hypothetical protein [Roseiarcus sp.]